jgi:AcrR family transcriptional regulator
LATELPGTRRPGGRTERTRAAVVQATLELLAERGVTQLTVEAVAERSGVHRSTIHRRWASVDGLVAAALRSATEHHWAPADTGTFEGDLRELLLEVVRSFTEPGHRELPTASVVAAFHSQPAADALHGFYQDRHARAAALVARAAARGEIPEATDAAEVIRNACGPLFYRLFISREPLTPGHARTCAAATTAATRAGAFEAR